MTELWRDIPDYEGIYQASNFGRIRSVPGKTTSSPSRPLVHWKTRIIKQKQSRNGRKDWRITLWKDNKPKTHLVARLVASAWLGSPKEGYTVNHRNGDFLNNNVSNLEWMTLEENIKHAFRSGFYSTEKPVTIVSENGKKRRFKSHSEADRFLGRSPGYISNAKAKGHNLHDVRGKKWEIVV